MIIHNPHLLILTIMKYISTIGFILFFTINCNSQDFWEPVSLPDSIEPYTVFLTDEGDFLLGTFEHGIYITEDDGMTWQHMGIYFGIHSITQMSNGDLFGGSGGQLFRTTNGGQTWDSVLTGFSIISMFCSTEDYLYIGNWGGIHKSVDSGYTWTQVHQSTSTHLFIDFAEKDGNLYSGSIQYIGNNSGIYRSEDGGDSWSLWSMAGIGVTPLTIDINEYLLAGVATHYPAGLFRVAEDGQSWEQLFGGADVVSILPDESNGIYIGLESDLGSEWGVRYSPDNGNSWEDISSGMEYITRVTDLGFNSNDYLFAVTSSPRSLYRSINPIVGIQDNTVAPAFKVLLYPNPFTTSFNVDLKNSTEGQNVSLEVYNMYGRLIKRMDHIINKSNQSIKVHLDDQPSGIYVLNILCLDYLKSHTLIKSN